MKNIIVHRFPKCIHGISFQIIFCKQFNLVSRLEGAPLSVYLKPTVRCLIGNCALNTIREPTKDNVSHLDIMRWRLEEASYAEIQDGYMLVYWPHLCSKHFHFPLWFHCHSRRHRQSRLFALLLFSIIVSPRSPSLFSSPIPSLPRLDSPFNELKLFFLSHA